MLGWQLLNIRLTPGNLEKKEKKGLTELPVSCIIFFVAVMGYRQMVRQRTLTPSFHGSNPCSPVMRERLVGFWFRRSFLLFDGGGFS